MRFEFGSGRSWIGALGGSLRLFAAALTLALMSTTAFAAEGGGPTQQAGPSEVVFLCQTILLLVTGRIMGEAMLRIGQPAVMGQLIAGILLGPSVLGQLSPDLQHAIFPPNREQKAMIDAVSQLGILMLLLLTGMETDLSVMRKSRSTALRARHKINARFRDDRLERWCSSSRHGTRHV